MMVYSAYQRLVAEFIGTAFLLATVVGSGIMADSLAGGNTAIALLGNTIPTGAILYVLITMLGPVSGAHFNPAVTFAFWLDRRLITRQALLYVAVQVAGGLLGVVLAHLMFGLPVLEMSEKVRSGPGQWISEGVATAGLVTVIFLTLRANARAIAQSVALYITAAYWFTASTSFANPAVTLARAFSDTFAGIRPADAPAFIAMQLFGAGLAFGFQKWLAPSKLTSF